MKTPAQKYLAACKDADLVYYDFDCGMTEDEWISLKCKALDRMIEEKSIIKQKEADNARTKI